MSIFSAKDSGANDVAPAPATPPVLRPAPSVALYVAAAIVQVSALAAVSFQLGEETFAIFTMGLTLLGTFVSFQLRRLHTTIRILKWGTILLGATFLAAVRGAGLFGVLVPPENAGAQEMLLVTALAFTATFASFLLITDDAVVFTCVWSIAIIGLTGTVNINRELPMCFVVFLAAASFLLVHQNALSYTGGGGRNDAASPPARKAFDWRLLRTHAITAGAAWATSLILGALVAIPVQMVGRNMSLSTIIQRLHVPPSAAGHGLGVPHLIFDSASAFNVGLGPVDDDPTERMTVWSARPQHWRGRTYDQYTGHGWLSSFGLITTSMEIPANVQPVNGLFTFNLKNLPGKDLGRKRTVPLINSFHIGTGTNGPLYHAAEPMVLSAPITSLFYRPDGTISSRRGNSNDYEVQSLVSDAKPSDLRGSKTVYPEDIRTLYLDYGPYNDRLLELANTALDGAASNPFDRASAIKRFVAGRATYTREARAVPKDRDAVDFFLNESHEGYCDLYATSMAVLCRYAGIPARVATGFAPGQPVEADTEPRPGGPSDKRTRYILRGSDLHSWAEVYFMGYGWIVFDPTEDTAGTVTAPRTPEPVKRPPSFQRFLSEKRLPLLVGLAGALFAGFAFFNETKNRFRFSLTGRPERGQRNEAAEAILRAFALTVRRLSRGRSGVPRPLTMTPGEYTGVIQSQFGDEVASPLRILTRLTEKASYGPESVTDEDARSARDAAAGVAHALKNRPKERHADAAAAQ